MKFKATMSNTLQAWLDDEDRIREVMQRGPGPGVGISPALAAMTGLEQLQTMLRGEAAYPSIGKTLDFMLVEVSEGKAVFQGAPGPGHLNPMGRVHGGWYATLLDSALGCSVHTCVPAGKAYTTLELKVNLVRALTPAIKRVRAIGRVIHVGAQTATAEARLEGPDGTLYAHGTTTCLVFDTKPRAS
jgi:uncharacterized protein (TIGR00369 family)